MSKKLSNQGSVLLADDASWAVTTTTEDVDLRWCEGVYLCLRWQGAGVFAFKLQSSAEPAGSELDDWADIADTDADTTDGSPITWNMIITPYRRIRLVATRTSGTMTDVFLRVTTNVFPRTGQNDHNRE